METIDSTYAFRNMHNRIESYREFPLVIFIIFKKKRNF